jgi:hypothetical protein
VLQTANDSKKLVETLTNEDFNRMTDIAESAHNMQMCVGTVISLKIDDPDSRQATIVFETEKQLENGDIEVTNSIT